jgi:hypothetical protein
MPPQSVDAKYVNAGIPRTSRSSILPFTTSSGARDADASSMRMAAACSFNFIFRYVSPMPLPMIWLTMMVLVDTPSSRRARSRRPLSVMARTVGMVAMMKSSWSLSLRQSSVGEAEP